MTPIALAACPEHTACQWMNVADALWIGNKKKEKKLFSVWDSMQTGHVLHKCAMSDDFILKSSNGVPSEVQF